MHCITNYSVIDKENIKMFQRDSWYNSNENASQLYDIFD